MLQHIWPIILLFVTTSRGNKQDSYYSTGDVRHLQSRTTVISGSTVGHLGDVPAGNNVLIGNVGGVGGVGTIGIASDEDLTVIDIDNVGGVGGRGSVGVAVENTGVVVDLRDFTPSPNYVIGVNNVSGGNFERGGVAVVIVDSDSDSTEFFTPSPNSIGRTAGGGIKPTDPVAGDDLPPPADEDSNDLFFTPSPQQADRFRDSPTRSPPQADEVAGDMLFTPSPRYVGGLSDLTTPPPAQADEFGSEDSDGSVFTPSPQYAARFRDSPTRSPPQADDFGSDDDILFTPSPQYASGLHGSAAASVPQADEVRGSSGGRIFTPSPRYVAVLNDSTTRAPPQADEVRRGGIGSMVFTPSPQYESNLPSTSADEIRDSSSPADDLFFTPSSPSTARNHRSVLGPYRSAVLEMTSNDDRASAACTLSAAVYDREVGACKVTRSIPWCGQWSSVDCYEAEDKHGYRSPWKCPSDKMLRCYSEFHACPKGWTYSPNAGGACLNGHNILPPSILSTCSALPAADGSVMSQRVKCKVKERYCSHGVMHGLGIGIPVADSADDGYPICRRIVQWLPPEVDI